MDRPGKLKREEGQAFVELVLVANILLLVVLAIFQFGSLYSQRIQMTDAARAAARKAATYGGTDTNDNTLRDAATAAGLASAKVSTNNPTSMSVSWKVQNNSWVAGNEVTATVSVPGSVDVLGFVVWSGQITGQTTMRIEKRGVS
jgi:Flp pilus assembly protein TadG